MATPITGAVSLANVRTELGLSGTIGLGCTLVRQLINRLCGYACLDNAHAAASVNSTTANLNVQATLFGSSGTVANYKVLIRPGVTVGASYGNTALVVGQFASGSTVNINNYGNILAYGGPGGPYYSPGSAGGDAIYAAYPNQTVTINNQSGALIYGGGGGGGSGGYGGTGGQGGQGYYTYKYNGPEQYNPQGKLGPLYNVYQYQCFCSGDAQIWTWNCFQVGFTCYNATTTNGYYRGSIRCSTGPASSYYGIGQILCGTAYTTGGAGGGGGAGGAGGRGQGYDGGNAGGAGGAPGAGGSGGGTNAGTGGSGGYGGTGGTGGGWGAAGGTGNGGATGNTGGSGNYTGGSGGSAGGGGQPGGAAGRYLVKSGYAVTLNNNGGGLAGGLA